MTGAGAGEEHDEDDALRRVALKNAEAIGWALRRADDQLELARQALDARTLELGQSLSLMRAKVESTADGILVTDREGWPRRHLHQQFSMSGMCRVMWPKAPPTTP